jgi:hypothetical protein
MPRSKGMNREHDSANKTSAPAKRRLFDEEHDHDDSGGNNITTEVQQGFVPATASSSTTANLVAETPQKKKQRKISTNDFFSPKSTQQKTASVKAVVTPEKPSTAQEEKKQHDDGCAVSTYVPKYIHKNLDYQRKGEASLTDSIRKTFELVETYYDIPTDFENNVRKYGPLSGTCFEERVINAYNMGLLKPISSSSSSHNDDGGDGEEEKGDEGSVVLICSECAVTGHTRVDCPELI